jgi:hypothetical protein
MKPPTPEDKTWEERFRLSRMMFAAILRTGDKVDELSTWVLGATGGIAALTVANLEHINAALKPEWEWWFAILLPFATVFGMMQKLLAFQIRTFIEVSEKGFDAPDGPVAKLQKIVVDNAPKDRPVTFDYVHEQLLTEIKEATTEVRQALPWLIRIIMDRAMKKAEKDPLAMYCQFTRMFFSQLRLLFLQLAALAVLIGALPLLMRQ